MVYPDLGEASYTYNKNSMVIETEDPAGNLIEDTYDALNRNTYRKVSPAAGFYPSVGNAQEWRTYDALGRITKNKDDDAVVEYQYAVNGLSSSVYEEKQSYATGSAYTKVVRTSHDAAGRVLKLLYPAQFTSGVTWDHTRNDVGLLTKIATSTGTTIADFTYIGLRAKTTAFENGTVTTTSYTGFRGEVASVHHQDSGGSTVLRLDYGYDGNHDRLYERFGGTGAFGDAFAYDAMRRLQTAWMGASDPTSTPAIGTYANRIDYVMDDDGNRVAVAVTPFGGTSLATTYTTNNANQYTTVGGIARLHDKNGNLVQDTDHRYVYDYRNQIVEVRNALGTSTVATYRYDALGRRIEKSVVATSAVSRYVYAGVETIEVYDGSDNLLQTFVFGDGIDHVLMLEQSDVMDFDGDSDTSEITRSFYHRNALGSVMEITEMDEDVAVSYRYDPYGAVTITSGGSATSSDPLGNPWMYTARFADEETGLYYFRARHFSPITGRFLQRDPLGVATGPNVYVYGWSSPFVYRDPLGLFTWKPGGRGGWQPGELPAEADGGVTWLDPLDGVPAWLRERRGSTRDETCNLVGQLRKRLRKMASKFGAPNCQWDKCTITMQPQSEEVSWTDVSFGKKDIATSTWQDIANVLRAVAGLAGADPLATKGEGMRAIGERWRVVPRERTCSRRAHFLVLRIVCPRPYCPPPFVTRIPMGMGPVTCTKEKKGKTVPFHTTRVEVTKGNVRRVGRPDMMSDARDALQEAYGNGAIVR